MPSSRQACLMLLMILFLTGCTSSCGGNVAGYGIEVGTRSGTFQPEGDRASYDTSVPYIELKGPSSQSSAQLRSQSAAPVLQPCKPFHLSEQLRAGVKPQGVMLMDGLNMMVSDNNGAAIMWLDTSADKSKVSKAMQPLMVDKGLALISSSTTAVDNTLNQALGAIYTIALPVDKRQPYKRVIFHLWGLEGSYTYAVYDAGGKEIYDPEARQVTFEIPQEVMPQAGKIILKVRGSHAFDVEATC